MMTFFDRSRGTILALVLGLGVLLFLFVMTFILFLQRESDLSSKYSMRIAARKLAEIGMPLAKQYLVNAVRTPGSDFSETLKLPLEDLPGPDDKKSRLKIDLKDKFSKIVTELEKIDYFYTIETYEAIISFDKNEFRAYETPLATYRDQSGSKKHYEKYGHLTVRVQAEISKGIVGPNALGASAEVSELIEIKTNVARIPLINDFTLFLNNAQGSMKPGESGNNYLNHSRVDGSGKLNSGPLIVLNNGIIWDWRPATGDLPYYDQNRLKEQGWIYMGSGNGSGSSSTEPINLNLAYGVGAYKESGGAAEDGVFEEEFQLFQGQIYSDNGQPKNFSILIDDNFENAVAGTDGEPYKLWVSFAGFCGYGADPGYVDMVQKYPSGKVPLNGFSSSIHLFGSPNMLSPTLVLGNVKRRYLRMAFLVLPDGFTDHWKQNAQDYDILHDNDIKPYDESTLPDWLKFAPLYYCSQDNHGSLGSAEVPSNVGAISDVDFTGGKLKYDFLKEFIPDINQWSRYESYMSGPVTEPYNLGIDFINTGGYQGKPTHVLEQDFYPENPNSRIMQYPTDWNTSVELETGANSLAAVMANVVKHFSDSNGDVLNRVVWRTDSGDEKLKLKEFLEQWNYLQEGTLKLGTVVYDNSGETASIGPFHVERGGIIVCDKSVVINPPITADSQIGEMLTIVSLNGSIMLGNSSGGDNTVSAHLIAPQGGLYVSGSGTSFNVDGAVAVNTIPYQTLEKLSGGVSQLSFNRALKILPGTNPNSGLCAGNQSAPSKTVMVSISPFGNPIPAAAGSGGE